MARTLIILGLLLVAAGVLVFLGERLPFRIGRLPGAIVIKGKNTVFYFPVVTSIVVSVLLSLFMWAIHRFTGK